jgi:hypothetical protein
MFFFDNEKFEFDPDELSLLLLTNTGTGPIPQEFFEDKTFVLTTKETYIWGIIISRIVQKNPEVSENEVIECFRKAVRKNKEYIQKYYSELPSYPFRYPQSYLYNERIFYDIIETMLRDFGVETSISELYRAQQKAFDRLVESDHIEDPIFTSIFGLSVAIVGFIPYGFTNQTKKGRTVHRKITAAFWSYEKKETSKDNLTTKISFRLWKVLTAFKKALAETTDDETGNN